VIQSSTRVNTDDLKILDREVSILLSFSVSDVHEESTGESLLNVLVVRLVLESGRNQITERRVRMSAKGLQNPKQR